MKISQILQRLKVLPSFFKFVLLERNKKRYVRDVKLIWNKKIAMSCDLYPIYYPKQLFLRSLFGKPLTYLSYKNLEKRKFKTIYVSLDFMDYFIINFLSKINHPFIIVTGDSDNSTSQFKEILDNPYLIHWFAQNNDLKSKKVTSIPIGIDYHTLFTSNFWREKKKDPLKQERELTDIRNKNLNKNLKVFANFHLNITSPRREEIYNLLKGNSNIIWQKEKMSRNKLWELQSKFDFNFSPSGAGLDCHRTWESLIFGQIPIVERTNTPLDDLHKQFPIVIINDLSEITQENLKKWQKISRNKFNPEVNKKLTSVYWIKKINK